MDEADGRPGRVAFQFGHMDALQDAPTPSLCHLLPSPASIDPVQKMTTCDPAPLFKRGLFEGVHPGRGKGETDEDVPGK
jgi:hypothetical protein